MLTSSLSMVMHKKGEIEKGTKKAELKNKINIDKFGKKISHTL